MKPVEIDKQVKDDSLVLGGILIDLRCRKWTKAKYPLYVKRGGGSE
jgi:hypothetical protein